MFLLSVVARGETLGGLKTQEWQWRRKHETSGGADRVGLRIGLRI